MQQQSPLFRPKEASHEAARRDLRALKIYDINLYGLGVLLRQSKAVVVPFMLKITVTDECRQWLLS